MRKERGENVEKILGTIKVPRNLCFDPFTLRHLSLGPATSALSSLPLLCFCLSSFSSHSLQNNSWPVASLGSVGRRKDDFRLKFLSPHFNFSGFVSLSPRGRADKE
ncbi:hypothetical protein EUGRSUZ_B00912 [Eucalyptus grandis]|uniref:Uncharacterized protein n=2 Tax=Eucalyptus grandis TaxID=71139 RepID=A0ACC3K7Y7_EUCGR|nr:hypothetical protein EUGRSUZ_B00912 [Eucalyptus grandis]